ncbi:hypothetical protein MKEN_00595500 [Mycena kentingensis (nom. inval.)]|nr:hypothetical protein MKEN_00595500 [Mycena kentingensis (nom. inval.)]
MAAENKNLPDLVIRQVTPDITIFSKPFTMLGFLPWGGRSTAVKLSTGDVWVLASTPLTPDTKSTIDAMGPVRWIIAADAVHHLYLHEFKKAYPQAKVIGVEALITKKAKGKKDAVEFDGAYGKDPANTKYGFEDEIYACYFSGFANKDVAFLHAATKTLIVADLLFNLPGNEQYSKSTLKPRVPLIGTLGPYGALHKHFVWGTGKDKKAMAKDAQTVLDWAPERVIMCHGDVIEEDATKAWATAYSKYFA